MSDPVAVALIGAIAAALVELLRRTKKSGNGFVDRTDAALALLVSGQTDVTARLAELTKRFNEHIDSKEGTQ